MDHESAMYCKGEQARHTTGTLPCEQSRVAMKRPQQIQVLQLMLPDELSIEGVSAQLRKISHAGAALLQVPKTSNGIMLWLDTREASSSRYAR